MFRCCLGSGAALVSHISPSSSQRSLVQQVDSDRLRETLTLLSSLLIQASWGLWALGEGRGSYRYLAFTSSFKESTTLFPSFCLLEASRALLLKLHQRRMQKQKEQLGPGRRGWNTPSFIGMSPPGQVGKGCEGFLLHPMDHSCPG